MKRLLIYVFLLPILVLFSGCNAENANKDKDVDLDLSQFSISEINRDVQLSIKESKIDAASKEITLVFENQSDIEYLYGEITYLDVKIEDAWYSIPNKDNVAWTALAYQLPPHSSIELTFPIDTYFDNIESGQYRIIKKLSIYDDPQNTSYIMVEFDIGNSD